MGDSIDREHATKDQSFGRHRQRQSQSGHGAYGTVAARELPE